MEKFIRTVLRGPGCSNALRLPDRNYDLKHPKTQQAVQPLIAAESGFGNGGCAGLVRIC